MMTTRPISVTSDLLTFCIYSIKYLYIALRAGGLLDAGKMVSNIIHLNNSLFYIVHVNVSSRPSDTHARMHIPYRFLLTLSDGETIKIDLHSNATCSVSNIKSSLSHWDRQTVTSSLLPPPSLQHLLLSPLGVPGTPILPRMSSIEEWQAVARAWLTACWCFFFFPSHTLLSLHKHWRTHTHTHTLDSPPSPPPAGVLVWVSVIAPGLVPCRLHTTIHTNHSMSALWMGPFWLCPCKVRPPLKQAVSVSCLFLYFPSHSYTHTGRCMMEVTQKGASGSLVHAHIITGMHRNAHLVGERHI